MSRLRPTPAGPTPAGPTPAGPAPAEPDPWSQQRRNGPARTSLRLGLAAIRAHRRRFAGTFVAVFLGVAFLAGTMVMGDTLRAGFGKLFADADRGTDTVVRGADQIKAGTGAGTRRPVPTDLIAAVRKVPGVAAVAPDIEGAGELVAHNGTSLDTKGPTVAGNWIADRGLNPYRLVEGRAPRASGEAVINRDAARKAGLRIGDTTLLRTPDPVPITIVGVATFGGEDGEGQTTFTALTSGDAERYLMPGPGEATTLKIRAAPGTDARQLTERVARVLPTRYEAITGQQASDETEDATAGTFLTVFTTLLVVFAGIALLVATFSIHNTFAIVVAQRTRENALLRALGASRRQVLGSTLAEAAAVACAASLAGLLGGIGVAAGLQALFPAVGFPFPGGGLVIHATALAVPLAVGLLVCTGSAAMPAVRAGRTAPVAALRETATDSSGASRWRAATGLGAGAAGIALTAVGVAGPSLPLTGLGAVLTAAAFVVLGPVAASVAVRLLGAPVGRLRGATGVLARRNALRSPRRTAATATALMIGVAVVSLFTVVGASLKETTSRTVDRSFAGDVAISAQVYGAGGAGLSPRIAPAVARLPQVREAVGLGRGIAEVDGRGRQLTVTDPVALSRLLDLGAVRGSLADLGTHAIAVARSEADKRGWTTGSRVGLVFADGQRVPFTVGAVYDRADLAGDYLITRAAWAPHHIQDKDTLVAIGFRPGVGTAAGKAAVTRAVAAFGAPAVQTRSEYAKSAGAGIDTFLTLVYALLALAVLIALLGIANTLALAVHERTRELGLLRAVGQTRAQLRSMVRWESVLVAAFGTAGGLGLGTFLGWALVRATDSDGSGAFAIAPTRLAVVLLVGVAAGVLAGWRPARRAARLDILRAVAAD
ncbi:putative ABC transport system permease protein [Streptomyces sp. DvalAA-14]|uniref:ABC transporter permease n=1 Tax=unclassified Streptomyces TaxID=2593676 RepID=UPI00081B5822|nr:MULTISPECIES: ABC transporter permease [unclassified Streptomyces]MYS18933.1 FtsX-like permease family protein [Streptomyces sp. SID4948]SCD32170.1 putative ABC transport system permease protein [Streptomyces sp. DvalAA-14]